MTLSFLKQTPQTVFNRLARDLAIIDPNIDLNRYKALTVNALNEQIAKLAQANRHIVTESSYGSWLSNPGYLRGTLLCEMLEIIRDMKVEITEKEVLVPGYVYYKGVHQFGDRIEGFRCQYLEESTPRWMPFQENVKVAKALTVMNMGDDEVFRRIYVEMADGRVDALETVVMEHLTESTPEALDEIEAFCESVWDGPWPWESRISYKLNNLIEEVKEMRINTLKEMRAQFASISNRLMENDMQEYELRSVMDDMMKLVDSTISSLGKISSSGIEAIAAAKANGSNTGPALEQALGQPLTAATEAMSSLKVAIQKAADGTTMGGSDMGGSDMGVGDDLGTPGDAMGENPDGLPGDISDVNLDGNDAERPMKGM